MCLCVCMYININTYIFSIFTTTLKRWGRERSRILPNFTRKGIKSTFGFLLMPFSNSFSSFTITVFFIFHEILKLYYVRNPVNTSNSLQIREHQMLRIWKLHLKKIFEISFRCTKHNN